MDLLTVLFSFIIIGVTLKVAVDYFNLILLPFVDLKKYSLLSAFTLSILVITAYNKGLLTTMEIPQDFSLQPYFHYVDLLITSLVMTGGAKAVNLIIKGVGEYKKSKEVVGK